GVLQLVELVGASAGRARDGRVPEADEGRPAVGVRRAHQLLRRAARCARRTAFSEGVDRRARRGRAVGLGARADVAPAAGYDGLIALPLPPPRRVGRPPPPPRPPSPGPPA